MVITRKIEIIVCEKDKELRKEYYKKLWANRDIAFRVANMCVSHLFALDHTMPYLSKEDREKIKFLGVKGTSSTKANATYVVASEAFKGKADMGMIASVLQTVKKAYQNDAKLAPKQGKRGFWDKSLRSYKENIPVPYTADRFKDLRYVDGEKYRDFFFTLTGIPFQMRLGSDRSGNRIILERIINGEYKMCTSSIAFEKKKDKKTDEKKQKMFLYLCVDIPTQDNNLDPQKKMYTFLGVMNPIVCTCEVNAAREYDSGMKVWEIGTADEFNYRRRQIQDAVRRCQINNRYSVGGKGRKKKCQAIEKWHEKENNYVDTKLHTYSRLLVDMAIKHKCGTIVLMNQTHREDKAKDENTEGDNFVLRNWTYYGLKEKISYKCKMAGIKLEVED